MRAGEKRAGRRWGAVFMRASRPGQLILGLFLTAQAFQVAAQSTQARREAGAEGLAVTARVDTRVELLSIVARLAEYREYVNNHFKLYAEDVDKHFGKHKQHPAVEFARKMRKSNGVGFDAVMSMAVHLEPAPSLGPRVALAERVPDARWGKESAEEFVKLLQRFYKDADCERFFQSHAGLYRTAEQRFQQLLGKIDFAWYGRFYGEVPDGSFNLYIGLLNGGGNFGPKVVHPDGKEDLYAIIGTWKMDGGGLPLYDEDILPTIIHEYNHSFINHLVDAHEEQLRAAGPKVFAPVAERMKALAYGSWQTTIVESLVRAAVIRYQFEHEPRPGGVAQKELLFERNRGFLWIGELFALLGAYENSRAAYPRFRAFFPLVVGYFDDLSKRIEYESTRFDELAARVASMSPFANGAQDVDPALTQLTFTFDKPLDPGAGFYVNRRPADGDRNPVAGVVGFNDAGSTLTLRVKLSPAREYEFVLRGQSLRTREGYPLAPYTVKFKTKSQ